MDWKSRHWGWGLVLELVPAAIFNFAVAFAVASVVGRSVQGALAAGAAVSAGLAAFIIAWAALRRFGRAGPRFAIHSFEPLPVEKEAENCEEPGELLLAEAVAYGGAAAEGGDELLLDDVLQIVGPETRVVRLFQPDDVPTAGELQERIERHLRSGCPRPAAPDASLALHEALAALRQSLR